MARRKAGFFSSLPITRLRWLFSVSPWWDFVFPITRFPDHRITRSSLRPLRLKGFAFAVLRVSVPPWWDFVFPITRFPDDRITRSSRALSVICVDQW
jgi:hypothetical protein